MNCIILDVSPEVTNRIVNEGDTASFSCQATGTPMPNISWYFNGVPVDKENTAKYNIMISEMLLNSIAKSSTLAVINVESSDIGTYTCKAVSFASTDISSGVLSIKGKNVGVHHNANMSYLCKLCNYWCYTEEAGIDEISLRYDKNLNS